MSQHEVAKGTSVTIHSPDPDEPDDTRWSIIGDLRAPGTDYADEANYDCGDALREVFPTVEFDCETSCFYCYCPDEAMALIVVSKIEEWLVSHRLAHPEWERNANRGYN